MYSENGANSTAARRAFSSVGFFALIVVASANLMGSYASGGLMLINPELLSNSLVVFILSVMPIYCFGLPLGYCAIRKYPPVKIKGEKLGGLFYLALFPVAMFLLYGGSYLGSLLTSFLTDAFGVVPSSITEKLLGESDVLLNLVFAVILGPFMEELMFRKLLIDRLRIYGEARAVIVTSVLFGLFHGNLSQLFYATTLGLLLGYLYLRTGKLIYSTGIHAFVNLLGGVLSSWLAQNIDTESIDALLLSGELSLSALPEGFGVYMAYMGSIWIMCLLGLALLIVFIVRKKFHFFTAPLQLPKGTGFKTVVLNAGMICFLIASLALCAVSLLVV